VSRLNGNLKIFLSLLLLLSSGNAQVLLEVSSPSHLFVNQDFLQADASNSESCRIQGLSKTGSSYVLASCLEDLGRFEYEKLPGPQTLELELEVHSENISPILAVYYKGIIAGNEEFLHKFSLPPGHKGYLKIEVPLPNLDYSRPGFIQFGQQGHRRAFELLQNQSRGWNSHLGDALCWNQSEDPIRAALGQQDGIGIISMAIKTIDDSRFKTWEPYHEVFPNWIFSLIFIGTLILIVIEKQKIRQRILVLFLTPVLLIFLFIQSYVQSLLQEERTNSEIEIQNRIKNQFQMANEYRGYLNSKMEKAAAPYLQRLQEVIEDREGVLRTQGLISKRYEEYAQVLDSKREMFFLADRLETQFFEARKQLISRYQKDKHNCARPGLKEVRVGRLVPLKDRHSQEEYLTRLVGMEMFSQHPISRILSEIRHFTGMEPTFSNGENSFTIYHSSIGMPANKTMVNLVTMRILKEYSFARDVDAEDVRKTFVGHQMIEDFEASGLSYRQFDTMLNSTWNFQEMGSVRGHEFRLHAFTVLSQGQEPWVLWLILGPESLEFHLNEYLRDRLSIKDYTVIGNSFGPHYHQGEPSARTAAALLSYQSSPQFLREIKAGGEEWIWYGSKISRMPGVVVVLGESLNHLQERMQQIKAGLIVLIFCILTLVFFLIRAITSAVHHPVMALSLASHRVRKGDYNEDVHISSADEFSLLAGAFQKILFRLRKSELLIGFLDKKALGGIQSAEDTRRVKTTILFCGLFESGLSQTRMEDFVDLVQEVIIEEMGMVDKFTSQALLAVFSEGMEKNAVCAALRINKRRSETPSLRQKRILTRIQKRLGNRMVNKITAP